MVPGPVNGSDENKRMLLVQVTERRIQNGEIKLLRVHFHEIELSEMNAIVDVEVYQYIK